MKCPVCKIDMIVVEHKKIELDYCTRCRGVWFDSGELELLLSAAKAPHSGVSLSPVDSAEKRRRCPHCGGKMNKVLVGKEPGVLIDACPQGEGLWFDGGEVDCLIGQLSDKAAPVASFLGEVFQVRDKPE